MSHGLRMRTGDKIGWVFLGVLVLLGAFVLLAVEGSILRGHSGATVTPTPVCHNTPYSFTYPAPAGC